MDASPDILHSHFVLSETAREFRLMKIICFTTIYFMSLPFEHCVENTNPEL